MQEFRADGAKNGLICIKTLLIAIHGMNLKEEYKIANVSVII